MVPSPLTDPVFVGLALAIVAFVFFVFLLARRTVLGLREGYQEGRRD